MITLDATIKTCVLKKVETAVREHRKGSRDLGRALGGSVTGGECARPGGRERRWKPEVAYALGDWRSNYAIPFE